MAVQNHVVKHHQTQLANCDDPKDDPPSRLLTLQAMFSPKWVYLKMGYTSPFMICIYIYVICTFYTNLKWENALKKKNGKTVGDGFFP